MIQGGEPAVGIDLGTTNSVIAFRDSDGKPATIPNEEGDLTTPSVVYFHPSGPVVGKEAGKVALYEPGRVAQFAKRDMGRSEFHHPICGHRIPPEVVQAFILRKLAADARLKLGDFQRVVITVPAYFNEPRRRATQDAGRLAGLEVVDIINEPTAAAIAFGVREGFLTAGGVARYRELVLVYDLGGGTFDATLMQLDGLDYRALATAGDVHLGGIDWNRRVVDYLAETFHDEHGVDPRNDAVSLQSLMAEAEDAKRALSVRDEAPVHLMFDGCRSRIVLTREVFESITEDLVQRTLFTVQRLLRDSSTSWNDVTRLLLVGGSTRMPMIQKMLRGESGKDLDRSLSPDEAVAHGAAVYAGLLVNSDDTDRPRVQVTNVNSHDLGVLGIERATGRARRQVLIPRNTPLPAEGVGQFVTGREDQASVVVKVVEGGDASGKHATQIGKCVVRELPPGLPAKTPVEVRFRYAANGRIKVEAWLPTVKQQARLTIERATGMSDALLEHWVQRVKSGRVIPEAEEEPSFLAAKGELPAAPPAPTQHAPAGGNRLADSGESWGPELDLFGNVPEPEEVESLLDDSVSEDELEQSSDASRGTIPPPIVAEDDEPDDDVAEGSDDALGDFLKRFPNG